METMEIWQIIGFTLMLLVMMYLTSSLDKSMKDTEKQLSMLWDNQKIQTDMQKEILLLLKRIELKG
tara:strand:+ start:299 stop:496 length:198 start_codon:yes stop_codon:yes gene_type:complete